MQLLTQKTLLGAHDPAGSWTTSVCILVRGLKVGEQKDIPGVLWFWGVGPASRRSAGKKRRGWVGAPNCASIPGRRRKEGRPQATGRERGERGGVFQLSLSGWPRSPSVWSVSASPWKRAALRAERRCAMGSPALRLLPPPLLVLLLLVPLSQGFPGRAGGGASSPAGHPEPNAPVGGWCGGRPLFATNSFFTAQGGG